MRTFVCFIVLLAGCSTVSVVKENYKLIGFRTGHLQEIPVLLVMYEDPALGYGVNRILFYTPDARLVIITWRGEDGEWFMKDLKTGETSSMGKLPDVRPPERREYESGI